ncbi:retinitis pigmentosa 1-like 1 protein [Triplophysa rosa]|uniref:Retinitis pigmentosa 1-like 1 protein n=1 Tax=Triplophysa rosa TaxID=992332 RepID=A0A9W7WMU5_TRIRA|nr:retinitis pigmentosa 1-like 1 protein [Triplophysa rosa]XP_057200482.1 retinitis pigmentosa 1-like 1 protein [Triplophysa rosa]XP_057200483.1 retinitis pigmentosa 1-like 1 protein [Triplophysa rosa]KAI7805066.1 putative retinitis pigmentosa 1-like 1 protein [Triplophysa rosa]
MQGATPGSFQADTQFKNEPHPPASSFSSGLTTTASAKRITFYKSGDSQFKGVKMAIHKRSFKCFDALLDDLSQKVPLPFGVRTITTPRGTRSIKHLEQLDDGGCYLCSDRCYVKPINMEAAGKRPTVWYHSHPPNARRKPSRPEDAPSGHQHRHPKRIVLVKNTDPAVRRSVLLSRRTARSLRVFMDEISELMQCNVKKLYTLEGCKIDSIQSLMQCPSVLVCAGREPFRPLLVENLRTLSDERLPGMGTRSRSSVCSEGHENKKNVNFGLETKKSIIHPRSDSSNRSTRFSLSSEKSYQNGLCMTPGQLACVSTCPYVKEMSVNDDIEKRVLVNKDGSLSVEMRVRFRLFSDETLQWSTEIKKSSTKLTDSGSANETTQRYLPAKAECSEPDSNSPSETEEAFATKLHKKHLEESLRQNCCNHCQEYDIWKNPMHKDPGVCKSLSSSGSSQKIRCKKTSLDSTHAISRSSEEYTEHVVEKASCFQQTVEEEETRVEYCARSRCCSRGEVLASKSRRLCKDGCESCAKNKCCYSDIREPGTELSPAQHYEVTEERAISAVSNSSKVLECLKDDQDDEYDDLPPSISRASNWSQSDHVEGDVQSKCIHCCGCQTSPRSHLSPRPPSKVSSGAVRSLRSKKYKTTLAETDGLVNQAARTTSAISNVSSRSPACISSSPASIGQRRAKRGARSIISRHSRVSCKSEGQIKTPTASDALEICEDGKVQENGYISAMPVKSSVCLWCGESKGLRNPKKTESQNAEKDGSFTSKDPQENCKAINNYKSDRERSETAQSKHSDASAASNNSKLSNHIGHEKCPEAETSEERAKSGMSTKSGSAESTKSKTNCIIVDREPTPTCLSEAKSDSATSNKSNPSFEHRPLASEENKSFVKMCCKLLETKATEDSSSADIQSDNEEGSCKTPLKSNASSKHSYMQKKDSNGSLSTTESNERVPSEMSNTSSASCKSDKSSHNLPETTVTSIPEKADDCETPIIVSKNATCAMSHTSIKITTPDAPASQEMKAEEDDKDMTQNALTVTSPSPRRSPSPSRSKSTKTKVKQGNSRETSGMSFNSKVSSRSQKSSKCHCHSSTGSHLGESKTQREGVEDESERVLSRSSGKSHLSAQSNVNNVKSLCSQFDEPLSPTSTASVSLGLPEEHKCDDFEEQSTNDITEDAGCKLEVVNYLDVEERPKTAISVSSQISKKTDYSTCKTPLQTLSPVSAEKVKSADMKTSNNIRSSSALSASSSRSKSPGSTKTATVKEHDTTRAEMTETDKASNKQSSKHHSERSSGQTTTARDCLASLKASECSEKSKKETSKHSSKNNDLICDEDNNGSLKTSKSDKRSVKEDTSKPNSVVMSDISQKCTSLPQENQNKQKASIINPDSSNVVLSKALSAADLLREIIANARPVSRESKSIASSKNIDKVEKIKESKSEKRSRSKHRKVSNASEHNNEEPDSIMPSYLPNASTTNVVNDWLMNNPIDGSAYEMDVEFTENTEIQGEEEASGDKSEAPGNITEVEEPHEEEIQMENNITQSCDERPQVESSELDKQCPSSVQVMKVLLGPKLDRCRSLPEVSPVYGRKLSRSAQGLLDCLANLQLIESDPRNEKHPKNHEVMTILQSLWLQEPSDDEPTNQTKREHQSGEDEFNLQSSSGVDVSSGSTGSVKGTMSGVVEKSETAHGKISPIPEQEALNKDKDEALMENGNTPATCEETSNISDPTTPDIAEQVQGSPENKDVKDSQENTAVEDDQSVENKDESDQTQQTSSNKSSGNDMTENKSSGTPPSLQRAPLAKRISQDPDPVWVLNLLKKLEKQFMLHYVDAMAEFKVKWDLDDNEMLNAMISELKEEVHKRIQSSITQELQKIQSRAGRGPRPPGNALSRESTIQTEQRRRRLRVMRNKSITFSRSEDIFTASGTENSDQRSDDEYCPCDACMKRKMASRVAQRAEVLSLAPVMMEFDLRKILQMKKAPVKPPERKVKDQNTAKGTGRGQDNNLEVLHEEVEKGNNDVRHCSNADVDNEEANDKGNGQDVCEDHETKDEKCDENDGEKVEEKKAVSVQEDAEKDVNATEDDDEKNVEDIAEVVNVENAVDAEDDKDVEKNMETTEKTTETDEETKSHEEDKPIKDEAEETKNWEDQPTTDCESKSNKGDLSKSNDDEKEQQNEMNDDGNQTKSPEDEVEKDKEEDEDQPMTSRVIVQAEVRQDLENENDKHDSTEEAFTEDTEKDKSAEGSGVDSERTSMESQLGSVENHTNQQAKLHDLQSFMESVESQGDSVVVITEQPPYKESDELHGRDNQKDISNGVMEWQISPKIRNKTYRRKKLKDSDEILMNGK